MRKPEGKNNALKCKDLGDTGIDKTPSFFDLNADFGVDKNKQAVGAKDTRLIVPSLAVQNKENIPVVERNNVVLGIDPGAKNLGFSEFLLYNRDNSMRYELNFLINLSLSCASVPSKIKSSRVVGGAVRSVVGYGSRSEVVSYRSGVVGVTSDVSVFVSGLGMSGKLSVSECDVGNYSEMLKLLDRKILEVQLKANVLGVFVELPPGGAQSSRAVKLMAMGISMVASVCYYRNLRVEYCSPAQVKKHLTGDHKAKKPEMKTAVLKRYNKQLDKFPYKTRKNGDKVLLMGKELEDIADSIACVEYGMNRKDGVLAGIIKQELGVSRGT